MNRWKFATVTLAVCIVTLLIGGAFWIRKDRHHTRVATLRSLYDYLSPPPQDRRSVVYVPIVLDLTHQDNELRYILNGQTVDLAKLRELTEAVVAAGPFDPIIIRPTPETPLSKIVATMRFLVENRVQLISLSLGNEWVVLTDRNFSKLDDVELMSAPEQISGTKN